MSQTQEPDSPTPFFHVSAIFLTTPENRIDPSCPVTRNRNGRSSTKSISSSGISAAVSEMPSSVYAAPVTPFSSISSMAACAKLGVKPEECLCVGDSPFDLQSGRSAGAKTVAVRYTAFGWEKLLEEGRPDFVIASPQELLELVGKAK